MIILIINVVGGCYRYQDVGEGWWEAKNEHGQRGLVPEAYLEVYTIYICFLNLFSNVCYFLFTYVTTTATVTVSETATVTTTTVIKCINWLIFL